MEGSSTLNQTLNQLANGIGPFDWEITTPYIAVEWLVDSAALISLMELARGWVSILLTIH